jgi:hypothetical protein
VFHALAQFRQQQRVTATTRWTAVYCTKPHLRPLLSLPLPRLRKSRSTEKLMLRLKFNESRALSALLHPRFFACTYVVFPSICTTFGLISCCDTSLTCGSLEQRKMKKKAHHAKPTSICRCPSLHCNFQVSQFPTTAVGVICATGHVSLLLCYPPPCHTKTVTNNSDRGGRWPDETAASLWG